MALIVEASNITCWQGKVGVCQVKRPNSCPFRSRLRKCGRRQVSSNTASNEAKRARNGISPLETEPVLTLGFFLTSVALEAGVEPCHVLVVGGEDECAQTFCDHGEVGVDHVRGF